MPRAGPAVIAHMMLPKPLHCLRPRHEEYFLQSLHLVMVAALDDIRSRHEVAVTYQGFYGRPARNL